MHHLIYIPGRSKLDPQRLLPEIGLGDQIPGVQRTDVPGEQTVIPANGDRAALAGGRLLSWGTVGPRLNQATTLHWIPALPLDDLPAGRYFVGIDQARPPQPHELLKPHTFHGTPVGMGDGNLWVVPHASELPFDVIRDNRGAIVQQPRPQFYGFWTKCLAWQHTFEAHQRGDAIPDLIEQVEFVEEALRLNYRLTPELISYLQLFNTGPTGTLRAALAAALHVRPGGGD